MYTSQNEECKLDIISIAIKAYVYLIAEISLVFLLEFSLLMLMRITYLPKH